MSDKNYLEIREFAENITKEISMKMGEGCEVKLEEVTKNNGVILQGLSILKERKNISPTIYLNTFYEEFKSGRSMELIMERILQIYEQHVPSEAVDMSFFQDFDLVKDKICYKVISRDKNARLLENVPNVELLDLSICFYYVFENEMLGRGTILIHNSHMEMWNVNVETLMKYAKENTPRIYPYELIPMKKLLQSVTEEEFDIPMEILTNEQRLFGATCMIYPGVLFDLSRKWKENLYLLPSSVHEVIIMPCSEVPDPEYVQNMIRFVNTSHVEAEEVLSDCLYFYNYLENRIDCV